uniref:Uncharacterized protein n=1 Tax=Ananas comosus var. bracteatus TaxID=296719 RepID=A0A6V7NEI2_ANACO|nr:unnamed protein product [Ananas comosus var. bracteatus]
MTFGTFLHVLKGLKMFINKFESDRDVGSENVHCSCEIGHFALVYRYMHDAVPVQQAAEEAAAWQQGHSGLLASYAYLLSPARTLLLFRRCWSLGQQVRRIFFFSL